MHAKTLQDKIEIVVEKHFSNDLGKISLFYAILNPKCFDQANNRHLLHFFLHKILPKFLYPNHNQYKNMIAKNDAKKKPSTQHKERKNDLSEEGKYKV